MIRSYKNMIMTETNYSAAQIAVFYVNYANKQFIDEGIAEGITNLKLQKILYFAQAASLALDHKPIFNDDIEAWKFGPVVPTVYHQYKEFGNQPLESVTSSIDLDEATITLLKSVWDIFGKFSAAELVNITHNHLPWREAFYSNTAKTIISQAVLEEYYKNFFSEVNG